MVDCAACPSQQTEARVGTFVDLDLGITFELDGGLQL